MKGSQVSRKILVHIVSWNSQSTIAACLSSVLNQSSFTIGKNLFLQVTDNNSSDQTKKIISEQFAEQVQLYPMSVNTGFCYPNNQAALRARERKFEYVLFLNPDSALEMNALEIMLKMAERHPEAGGITPLLLRADKNMNLVQPQLVDAAGIFFTPSLRHFDRFSGERKEGCQLENCYVFGGTGAALLLKMSCILDLNLDQSKNGIELFDEDFFAYREDADLAWRMQNQGWKTIFTPAAIVRHQRQVTPENRSEQSSRVNSLGVQNRFLLQLKNLSLAGNWHCLPQGLARNLLVIFAALSVERPSAKALFDALRLIPSQLRKRNLASQRRRVPAALLSKWFSKVAYTQALSDERLLASPVLKKIRAIVVCYRSGERALVAVESLLQAKNELQSQLDLSISVVDNDHSFTATSLAGIDLLRPQTNLGFAGGINMVAANHPDADCYLVLNPDIEVNADAVQKLTLAMEQNPQIAALSPVLIGHDQQVQHGFNVRSHRSMAASIAELLFLHRIWPENPWTVALTRKNDQILRNYLEEVSESEPYYVLDRPMIVDQPAAACLLLRKQAFLELGGFDKNFWPAWFEDVDFFQRLQGSNWLAGIVGKAKVKHEGGYSKGQISAADYTRAWYGNMYRFAKKYYSPFFLFRLFFSLGLLLRLPLTLLSFKRYGKSAARDHFQAILSCLFKPESSNKEFAPNSHTMQRDWRSYFSGKLSGNGIELGPLHRPLPVHQQMKVRYLDRMNTTELRQHYPELKDLPLAELDIIDNAETLESLTKDSEDFIIAAHLIEHTRNPFLAIEAWCRVVKPGGYVYLIVPDSRYTFDSKRILSSLEHLILDYRNPDLARDHLHFLDYAHHVGNFSGAEALTEAKSLSERDYSIHFHVFSPQSMLTAITWLARETGSFEIVEGPCKNAGSDEFSFLLRVI